MPEPMTPVGPGVTVHHGGAEVKTGEEMAALFRPHWHFDDTSQAWIYDPLFGKCVETDQRPVPLGPDVEIPEHWTFHDRSVAAGFERHVREQLPWYDLVSDAVVQITAHYLGQGGRVIDVGASTGNIARRLADLLEDRNATILSVEESPQMADKFVGPGEVLVGSVQDLMGQIGTADVIVCNLVLMFLRAADQAKVLQDLHCKLEPGGALLVIERMLPPSGYLSIVHSRLTLAAKRQAGVPAEEILSKELSLAGSQRPMDARLLLAHGAVEWFRFGDFAGWVIAKELPHRS